MKKINDRTDIIKILYEFDDVFPHNKEKIIDYNEWAEKINCNGIINAFNDEGENIGLAVYYANDMVEKKGYISLFGLKEKYCGKGLGKLLLDSIINEIREYGMRYVCLEVDNDNQRAERFYLKYGFIEDEKRSTTQLLRYRIA